MKKYRVTTEQLNRTIYHLYRRLSYLEELVADAEKEGHLGLYYRYDNELQRLRNVIEELEAVSFNRRWTKYNLKMFFHLK